MIVHTNKFLALMKRAGVNIFFIAQEVGISLAKLARKLKERRPFDYDESKRLLDLFGADEMMDVIDWEGTNASRAV